MKRKKSLILKNLSSQHYRKSQELSGIMGLLSFYFLFEFYLAQNNLAVHNKATGTVLQYVNF